jgi:NTP pyrophosphatase (non-canonical NTP hydrolase)
MTNVTPLHQMTLAEARAKAEAINYDPDWTIEQLLAATAHMTQAEKAELGQALRIVGTAMQAEARALEAEGAARVAAR